MGIVIKRRNFPEVIKRTQQGIFLLAPNVPVPVSAAILNVGLSLGERMYKAKSNGLEVGVAGELNAVWKHKIRNIVLKNIDILFLPDYELDVIKLLLQLGRNQKLYIEWPGDINGEKLIYSKIGEFDYKEYDVKNYVDTYIVLR